MKSVLLLHGANLNRLGKRDPEHYGTVTLSDLVERVRSHGRTLGLRVQAFASNHEGELIDAIQEATSWADGAIVNLGAYSHTSYALHDAIVDFGRPVVEVHLSKVSEREPWRRTSVIRPACVAGFEGLGPEGYDRALDALNEEMERR